jgi:hypothetical protein
MNQITSVHIADGHMHMLTLSSEQGAITVDGCHAVVYPRAHKPLDLALLPIAPYLTHSSGSLVVTLGGGLFHIQRVPLELASESDRIAQIKWEASQVLIESIDRYVIDFLPAGRVAFWTAIPQEVATGYTAYFSELGFDPIVIMPEPMALYALGKHDPVGRNRGAIWVGHEWSSFVAIANDALTVAETVNLRREPHQTSGTVSQIKKWIQGDLGMERRRPAFDQILLCGEANSMTVMASLLADFKTPRIVPFDFSTYLPDIQTPDSTEGGSAQFALALGAALAHA